LGSTKVDKNHRYNRDELQPVLSYSGINRRLLNCVSGFTQTPTFCKWNYIE